MSRREKRPPPQRVESPPRVLGGQLAGRKLIYSGDARTRPMKGRVREALFNLVGTRAEGTHALDLFAGTGALGIEALSRGAARATFVEQHFPTAEVIRQNVAALGLEEISEVVAADAFRWIQAAGPAPPGSRPWLVFISPPFDFFVSRRDDMLAMVQAVLSKAPSGSLIALEADERFDFESLPEPDAWDVRHYPPAVLGIYPRRGER